jgi:hypothetical protein
MLCLQLNRVPLNNEYLRLPRELLDCCATVAVRPNMSKDLVSAMQRRFKQKIKEEFRIEIRTLCVLQKAKQNYQQIDFDRAV